MEKSPDHQKAILDAPLFVVGPGRGGTTYLQRLLLADKRFCGGQESHFFPAFAKVIQQFDRKLAAERPHGLACYWRRESLLEELRAMWSKTFRECVESNPEALILVEKTPVHDRHIGVILELLPRARFLHIVRDSRAVAASLMAAYRDGWGRSWAPSTARGAAAQWNRSISSAIKGSAGLVSEQFLRIYYEHLLQDRDSTLGRISDWLALAKPKLPGGGIRDQQPGSFWYGGELTETNLREPKGFVRHRGQSGWQSELNWAQRNLVWQMTRKNMQMLGYRRNGSIEH